jgi:hypothetical protein
MAGVVLVIVGLVLTAMISCATLGTVTPGCEKSFTYQHKKTFDTIMTASVLGLYTAYAWKPEIYGQAHQAAQMAISVLGSKEPSSLNNLAQIDGISLIGVLELVGFFGANQLLDSCDKDYLIAYLKMV